jgi:hypothetical protein
MFKIFKTRQEHVEELMDAIKDASEVEPATTKLPPPPNPVYQIGRTEDGRITLRIGDGYAHSTLTMTDSAVKRLIRMLEVAVEEDAE